MTWIEVPIRPSRRRVLVFSIAFLAAAAASLSYVYTRPAEYRAAARLQITPASAPALVVSDATRPAEQAVPYDTASFLTEVQVLTSRPLLGDVVERLRSSGELPDLGADPIAGAQHMLSAEPVAGTQVVVLTAEGTDRPFLPRLVNAVTEAYRQRIAETYKESAASAVAGLIDEEKSLAQDVTAKQAALEQYRKRYDIVSLERDENEVLGKLNGLNTAYTAANTKLSAAAGDLEAARKAAAEGVGAASAKDDPTLADLEKRASLMREQLQELQRNFTPAYLALDPNAKALQARLADLDKQIAERRVTSRRASLATAEEAYASAKVSVDELTRQIAENQHEAQDFATHLSAYKAMQQDLDHVEALHRNALDRLTQLQATTRQRAPQVEILEPAAAPHAPWRPDYQTDAIASLAGSLVFGLFAVLFGEFIAGPTPSPGMTVRHTWVPSALGSAGLGPPEPALAALPRQRELAAPSHLVELPAPDLRELVDTEIAAMISAGEDARIACVGLLMGLTADELVSLRWDAVDLGGNIIRVPGTSARRFALEEPLRGLMVARAKTLTGPEAAGTLFRDGTGAPLEVDEVARLVLYAAYDARLERPHEITPAVLRHTYLAFLLRQGMRMSDITRIAGQIPHSDLVAYAQIARSSVQIPFEQIERILPALRGAA
ncbi:MAG TPA: hypothetical protein VLX09_09680 [Stellaceae bacterium]|nr:hypothetical protein [Stellaceae bacterium]